jgi:ligand-binding sensor protein
MDNPLEIMSAEQWDELLEELASDSLMATALMDTEGSILRSHGRRSALCKLIRDSDEARMSVCSQTSQAMLELVRVSLTPVIEECEAGMLRLVIPVVRDGILVFQVAACGRLAHDGEIETFLVSKLLDMEEADVTDLSRSVTLVARRYLQELGERFFLRLNEGSDPNI